MSALVNIARLLTPEAKARLEARLPPPVAEDRSWLRTLDARFAPTESQEADMDTPGLLKLIGDKEAPKGYNQMYGEKNPSTDLTGLTVDQVLKLQAERKKAGVASTAVGRYQFLQSTLGDLKGTLKLKGDEKFDPALQDRLAGALLERRGLADYKAGKITSAQFANSLAKEWASLPVVEGPNKGKSHYEGDGLNKALIKPEEVLTQLHGEPKGE